MTTIDIVILTWSAVIGGTLTLWHVFISGRRRR
jgi:hypothetical protein